MLSFSGYRCYFQHMTRVMVIGNASGGKSTLSRTICAVHGLPHVELDQMLWKPNWQATPEAEFRQLHSAAISQDRWLIDGVGPWPCVETRIAACDTVVFIDLPLCLHFWWAAKRQAKSLIFGRADGPPDCPMWPVTLRLFRMMWWLHREIRPRLLDLVGHHRDEIRMVHIKSRKELRAFSANPV